LRRYIEVVKTLLNKGQSININKARTADGATPLYAASVMGHVGVVEVLLAKAGFPNPKP
jgi:ankyrin repeat protein